MTLIKWKKENSLYNIFNNMDNILNNHFLIDSYIKNDQNSSEWSPSFDIKEYDNSYKIIADMPGIDKKDVNISIDEDMLVIEGNRKLESDSDDRWYCREIEYGNFKRSFYLPENINKDKISASLENGVLSININKIKAIKPKLKQINIK